jgi:RNA polymerase subunit RPABC4/transcription elongation factor Spt4
MDFLEDLFDFEGRKRGKPGEKKHDDRHGSKGHDQDRDHGYPQNSGETSACAKCAVSVPASAKFCPGCGAPAATTAFCANCGGKMAQGAAFCQECGTKAK